MVDKNFPYNEAIYVRKIGVGIRVMVLNATFNNISVILWWSVLFVAKET
jgi:hypothetical protein